MAIKRKRIYTPGGKYIRDSIHGDIFLEDKFVKRYNEVEEKKKIIIQPKAIAGNIYHNQQINHYKNSYIYYIFLI